MNEKDILIFLMGLLVAPIASLLTYVYTKKGIALSATNLAKSIKNIGSGNLTVVVERDEKDDKCLEQVYRAINEMTGRFVNTVSKLTYSAENIDKMASSIYKEIDGLKTVAAEQKNVSADVSAYAGGITDSIQEISESIESLEMASSESMGGIAELNEDAELMTTNITELKSIVDESISGVVNMSAYVLDAAKGILSLKGYGNNAFLSVKEIETAVREIDVNTEEADRIVEKLFSDATEGAAIVETVLSGILKSREVVQSSSKIMDEFGERSSEIADVIVIINGITDRTKLLALNASIIAAEAGEYGKGFAVVSDEIEKLSNMTNSSTEEIRDIVKRLQDWADKGIDSMRKGLTSIDEAVDLSSRAGKTLDRILESSRKAAKATGEIAKSTKEQSIEAKNALESTKAIKAMIEKNSDVAQQEAENSATLNKLMSEMSALMDRVNAAAEKRTSSSVMIAESYELMSEMLHLINNASKRQDERGKEISIGSDKIIKTSIANSESSENLVEMVRPLKDLSSILKEEVGTFKI